MNIEIISFLFFIMRGVFVNDMNECATTDRMIENIIAKSKELDHYYKANFENIVETKKNKDDMEL